MALRNILVPTDFSPHSHEAVDQAIGLAQIFSARLTLLHSYGVSLLGVNVELLLAELLERTREAARAELERVQKRVSQAGIACEGRLLAQPAVTAILDEAQALPADLVVMGTHGYTGLQHALLGSVAERVVRLAPCPVLTVKAPLRD